MGSIRWYSLVAAMILAWGAAPLFAQTSPLEELEAKLSKQQQEVGKNLTGKAREESLPIPQKVPVPKGVDIRGVGPGAIKTEPNRESAATAAEMPNPAEDPTPYLGLTLGEAVPGQIGLMVEEVAEQSPAWKSGFRISDRVLAVSGKAVGNIDQFADEIIKFPANEPITFLVDRRGRQIEVVAVMLPKSIAMRTVNQADVPFRPTSPSSQRSLIVPRTPQVVDGRGNLGLVLANLSDAFRRQFGIPVYRGASVLEVEKNSPGAVAGLAPGDCIVEIDGQSILTDEDVVRWKREATPGLLASVGFYRSASKMQTMLQVPFEAIQGATDNLPPVTPEMLTPEYVRSLQAELTQTRAELMRAREEIRRLVPQK
jgi:membrane-associated protease RseP (regulator of RpoE activity)